MSGGPSPTTGDGAAGTADGRTTVVIVTGDRLPEPPERPSVIVTGNAPRDVTAAAAARPPP